MTTTDNAAPAVDLYVEAAEAVIAADDTIAHGLVGAIVGDLRVVARERPGRRWLYVVVDRTGKERRLRGYEVVRAAREAQVNGLPVVCPTNPWRDSQAAQVAA